MFNGSVDMVHLTHSIKTTKAGDIKRNWHHINAKGAVVGRLATRIAKYLIGKHKTNYVSHLDMGDHVVVTNVSKVKLTGRKKAQKIYSRYSGYPGGLKVVSYKKMAAEKPEEIIRHAVMGMLPKNKLRDRRINRLYIYRDEKHPFEDKFSHKIP